MDFQTFESRFVDDAKCGSNLWVFERWINQRSVTNLNQFVWTTMPLFHAFFFSIFFSFYTILQWILQFLQCGYRWTDWQANGWTSGWTDQWRNGTVDGQTYPLIKMRCTHQKNDDFLTDFALWTYGPTDQQTNGPTDWWTNRHTLLKRCDSRI